MKNDTLEKQNTETSATREKKAGLKNKFGDLVEKIGHQISDAGAPKLGQKIHDLGDKLEDKHNNPSHPHKV